MLREKEAGRDMKKYAMGKKLDRYEKILYFISAVIVYGFCYIYHAVFQIKNRK